MMIKVILCLAMQNEWKVELFDFQNDFKNEKIDSPLPVRASKQLLTKKNRILVAMKLHRNL